LLVWILLVGWIFPEIVARAYSGEGFERLGGLMSGRDRIGLDEYLGDLATNGLRVSLMLGLLVLISLGWAAKGLGVTDPWLEPAPVRDLAVVRVVAVGLQLGLLLWPGVPNASLSADPTYSGFLASLSTDAYQPILALKILLPGIARPGPDLLLAIWFSCVAGCVLGVIGLGGRIPLLIAAWSTSTLVAHAYSYGEYHHPEALHGVALWLVALAPSCAAFSIDSFRRRTRLARMSSGFSPSAALRSPHARWPLTLLGLLFAMTYFDAAIEKLLIGGVSWFGSGTLGYHIAVDATRWGISPGMWLAQHAGALGPMSYMAWGIEFFFPLALVLSLAAPILVAAAIAMHVGIWVLHGPPFLQHILLVGLPFQQQMRAARDRWFPRRTGLRVLYDGHCDLCIRSVCALETLDVSGRLAFVDLEDGALAREIPEVDRIDAVSWMHVVDDRGTVWRGFFAFRRLARGMPALWPGLPLLYAPLSGHFGPRIYDLVARRRSRRGCRVHVQVAGRSDL
jgi:predicted DCC family thiol-disulfide oxidoreductase YuxK